ncbi:glycine cleavage system aminomethyltransferase GcvT [Corynebacterium sp. sy017]|uniref:glycine cleavage system aminomethyltransferase GcvT n=1 Tax=unclassified Corynebacterium TaxID=2624378 RepID=UPI0011868096|nr:MULTISPECIES: glycine cleavage system aminomethyltransferase GcvT [unclassified Corynebacterium]MBP3088004.1 glycine cleavage system aminomethyltransferase GcvT [Corynebacterium sp. sy017]TSD92534.1 glycine cleavage system aminomethyltransferase GcvT [Corynebacterium sp. SY003]
MSELIHSPLHNEHEKLEARFTPFGQWNMPLKYGSELEEHRAVRSAAGLFDLSHMGEIRVSGAQAGEFLDYALISLLSALPVGKAKYSMIVAEDGGIIDDLITYRLAEQEYLVVPNAGNATTVFAELEKRAAGFEVSVVDESKDTALIAVQGPRAEEIVLAATANTPETDPEVVRSLRYYACAPIMVDQLAVLLARTGYTGEDGFELYVSAEQATILWQKLLAVGAQFGLIPAGLAARDSLRLEAGMPLYGNELSRQRTPISAGLGVLVSKKKQGDFVGKQALSNAEQPTQVLVGLVSKERRAARAHTPLLDENDQVVGEVTSGQPSPTLGHPIALAYVDRAYQEPGSVLRADIRGKHYAFEVVKLPFYSRD